MHDATIQNDAGLYQQGQFPSVVTTDDLVLEIGRMAIDRLNKDKLILSLLNKSKAIETDKQSIESQCLQAKKESNDLRVSNKSYEETNKKLGDELVIARRGLAEKDQKILLLTTSLAEMSSKYDTVYAENTRILEDIEKLHSVKLEKVKKHG